MAGAILGGMADDIEPDETADSMTTFLAVFAGPEETGATDRGTALGIDILAAVGILTEGVDPVAVKTSAKHGFGRRRSTPGCASKLRCTTASFWQHFRPHCHGMHPRMPCSCNWSTTSLGSMPGPSPTSSQHGGARFQAETRLAPCACSRRACHGPCIAVQLAASCIARHMTRRASSDNSAQRRSMASAVRLPRAKALAKASKPS
mmetsp:Transcript_142499/g.355177  ORF Transcript_142499/g.355177 Transcript_142499/m.355177 type:complete len:205 (+) Transcript_142499:1180-1794(+)